MGLIPRDIHYSALPIWKHQYLLFIEYIYFKYRILLFLKVRLTQTNN